MRASSPIVACALSLIALAATCATAAAFSQPQQLHSRNGVLKATFNAEPGVAEIDGRSINGVYGYNGRYLGPTLNVKPGDRIELTVKNGLPSETNIHFHGMHVSPAGNSDNVLRRFVPGKTYKVSVKIPHDHANGLYWYHPHLHGQVNGQVWRGMAGMISVSGGATQVKALKKFKRRQLGVSAIQYDATGAGILDPNDQNDAQVTMLVNRRSDQSLTMRPGAVEMWRIANMSNEIFSRIELQGHNMWVVGTDGNPTRVALRRKQIDIPPGSRVEVLVRAGGKGSYKLRQLANSDGFNNFPAQDLLTLNVAGSKVPEMRIPRHIRPFEDLSKARVTTHRTWRLGFTPDSDPTFHGLINGKIFSPDRIDTVAKIGGVEEWTIVNTTTQQHPIHIHTNPFQVVAINGKRRTPEAPRDNFIVPAMGSVKLRFKPLTYTGVAVFHCHILFHEDSGMMATIKFAKKPARSSSVLPAGAPSVHDASVAGARAFDAGSIDPIGGEPHGHGAHGEATRQVPGVPPMTSREAYLLFCKLNGIEPDPNYEP